MKNNIQTRNFYKPLNSHKPYQTSRKFPIAQKISKLGLYLPSSVNLTYDQVEYICKKINLFFN
ncbi:MAG: DegT/DnrJ/EryC1/StrS family aminotransferase [Candidatus Dadabacteria bacterium]|nr:DegT/DnrJ/EryC1/StrS family aminotransferase [Candidatus Dadabacteria bacterium]